MPLSVAVRAVAVLCTAVVVVGCASDAPVQWRLQVRTTEEWRDTHALAERVEQLGGVPVDPEVAPIAPQWYALTLQCDSRTACKRATMKLAAQRSMFVELRRDVARRTPSRPLENDTP
jgi:hypothetical protein